MKNGFVSRFAKVVAAASLGVALSSSIAAADYMHDCTPTNVYENSGFGTVFVTCATGPANAPDLRWYALGALNSTADQRRNLISLATAALLSGKTLRLWTRDNPGRPNGCADSNCRGLGQYELVK